MQSTIALFRDAAVSLCKWFQKFRRKFRLRLHGPWTLEDVGDTFFRHAGNSAKQCHIQKAVILITASSCEYDMERYVTSGLFRKCVSFSLLLCLTMMISFQQTAGRPFSCTLDAEEWRYPTSGPGVDTRRVQLCLDLSVSSSVSACYVWYCYAH